MYIIMYASLIKIIIVTSFFFESCHYSICACASVEVESDIRITIRVRVRGAVRANYATPLHL